jgi:DNA helicase-2/ATP-dependent DNA helicase PcrA
MLGRGIPAEAIAAMTFTNKAAGEMTERVRKLVGGGAVPMMGTFHSLCARFLRRHAPLLGFPAAFAIADTDDTTALVKKVMREEERNTEMFPPEKILSRIDQWKNDGLAPDQVGGETAGFFDKEAAAVWGSYEKALRAMGAIDFGNLLLFMCKILSGHPEVRDEYRRRFSHILVDEYQDTNKVQFRLLTLLAGEGTSIFAVGDEDQCIYGWRGACLDNILDFKRRFPDAGTVVLEENYRSTATILAAANSLVTHNPNRNAKRLFTSGPAGEKVTVWSHENEYREAAAVAGFVADWTARGNDPADIGVLYRVNAQGRALEEALRARQIPYKVHGGVPFYRRAEVRDLLAWLRAAVNPADDLALRRAAGAPPRGLGDAFWEWLEGEARVAGTPMQEALRRTVAAGSVPQRHAGKAAEFAALLDRIAALRDDAGIAEAAARVTGLADHWAQRSEGEEGERRRENLAEVSRGLARYLADRPDAGVGDWLADVALASEEEADKGKGVHLMTLHSAKGLEFPVVMILGLEEGLIPHSRSAVDPRQMEEERRLLYVGMTRARSRLILSQARMRGLRGKGGPGRPSPFLADIDRSTLDVQFLPGSRMRDEDETDRPRYPHRPSMITLPSPAAGPSTASKEGAAVKVGSRVRHKEWGEGVVTSLSGAGETVRAEVLFRSVGRKKLALLAAPLVVLS